MMLWKAGINYGTRCREHSRHHLFDLLDLHSAGIECSIRVVDIGCAIDD